MKASILAAATALLAATAQAAPAPVQKEARQFQVSITFHGAAGQSYSQSFPADDTTHAISESPRSLPAPLLWRWSRRRWSWGQPLC